MTTEIAPFRMLGQIQDTGRAIRLALDPLFRSSVAELATELAGFDRLYATGLGTSMHAATYARYALAALAGVDVTTVSTSDLLGAPPPRLSDGPLLAFSHSGVSKASVDAAAAAASRVPLVVSIVSVDGTPLTRIARRTLVIPGGRDTALAKTKSFTVTLLGIALLGLELGRANGHLSEPDAASWNERLDALASSIDEAVGRQDSVAQYVERVGDPGYWFFAGSYVNAIIAAEAALKMKEANYATAEGFEAEEAGHGRIQPVDDRTMAVFFATDPSLDGRLSDIVAAVRAVGARVTIVGPANERNLAQDGDERLLVPAVAHPLLSPIVNVVPGQQLAYEVAVAHGYDPDLIRTDDPRYGRANTIVFPPGTH